MQQNLWNTRVFSKLPFFKRAHICLLRNPLFCIYWQMIYGKKQLNITSSIFLQLGFPQQFFPLCFLYYKFQALQSVIILYDNLNMQCIICELESNLFRNLRKLLFSKVRRYSLSIFLFIYFCRPFLVSYEPEEIFHSDVNCGITPKIVSKTSSRFHCGQEKKEGGKKKHQRRKDVECFQAQKKELWKEGEGTAQRWADATQVRQPLLSGLMRASSSTLQKEEAPSRILKSCNTIEACQVHALI